MVEFLTRYLCMMAAFMLTLDIFTPIVLILPALIYLANAIRTNFDTAKKNTLKSVKLNARGILSIAKCQYAIMETFLKTLYTSKNINSSNRSEKVLPSKNRSAKNSSGVFACKWLG